MHPTNQPQTTDKTLERDTAIQIFATSTAQQEGNNMATPVPYRDFVMSIPETPEAQRWLMELDFVDVLEGSLDLLADLAERAPTEANKAWLHGLIFHRRSVETLHPTFSE